MITDIIKSCGHCKFFQLADNSTCWRTEGSTVSVSSCWIWNSSAGIPSPPLGLFVVMLPMNVWLQDGGVKGCALNLLLRELQNYNSLLNNCQQENVGTHQKNIPHVEGQRRSHSKMVGGTKSQLESNPIPSWDTQRAQTKPCAHQETPQRLSQTWLSVWKQHNRASKSEAF